MNTKFTTPILAVFLALFCGLSANAQRSNTVLAKPSAIESPTRFEQVQTDLIDLTGSWQGFRYQYDETGNSYSKMFDYTFDLHQTGNTIRGTSVILAEDGNYSEVSIRGILVGDRFHFEEYQTQDSKSADHLIWCYKSGELAVSLKSGRLVLQGKTASYNSSDYSICSGGFSLLESTGSEADRAVSIAKGDNPAAFSSVRDVTLTASPNPFGRYTAIDFEISESGTAELKLIDLGGTEIAVLHSGVLSSGHHSFTFETGDQQYPSGPMIASLSINDKVYSTQLIHVK